MQDQNYTQYSLTVNSIEDGIRFLKQKEAEERRKADDMGTSFNDAADARFRASALAQSIDRCQALLEVGDSLTVKSKVFARFDITVLAE